MGRPFPAAPSFDSTIEGEPLLLDPPLLGVPQWSFLGGVVLNPVQRVRVDQYGRLLVQRNRRQVLSHQGIGLVQSIRPSGIVQDRVAGIEQLADLLVAVTSEVLGAFALPDLHRAGGVGVAHPREHEEVVVAGDKDLVAEDDGGVTERGLQLDPGCLRLLLDDLKGELTQGLPRGRGELEAQSLAIAGVDAVRTLLTSVLLE